MYKVRGTGYRDPRAKVAPANISYAVRDKQAASKVLASIAAKLPAHTPIVSITPVIGECNE